MDANNYKRDLVLLISGKRKSGKDYICEQVVQKLGINKACIMRISEPLKSAYAKNHNLDIHELMGSGIYKEKFRLDMIKWSDEIRESDPGYFCRLADEITPKTVVTLVSDVRRPTDMEFFENNFAKMTKRIKIIAELKVRESRGYCFTPGVDDGVSECGLDGIQKWDLILSNNCEKDGEEAVKTLLARIHEWQQEMQISD